MAIRFGKITDLLDRFGESAILEQIGLDMPGPAKLDRAVSFVLEKADAHLFPFDRGEGRRVNVIAETLTDALLYAVVRPLISRELQRTFDRMSNDPGGPFRIASADPSPDTNDVEA